MKIEKALMACLRKVKIQTPAPNYKRGSKKTIAYERQKWLALENPRKISEKKGWSTVTNVANR